MSSVGITTPSLVSESANPNLPVSIVNVQEQNSLASDLTSSNSTANSNQAASNASSTSFMSLNVEQFSSLEAFYSALRNASAGNSGLQLTVQGSIHLAARVLLPEFVAGNGGITPERMTSFVQGIQNTIEVLQRHDVINNENTILVINGSLIEWAIKSTIVNFQNNNFLVY
jgi:hypothetical protein